MDPLSPQAAASAPTASSVAPFISRIVKGDIPLWKIFWFLFIPAPLVLYAAHLGILWILFEIGPLRFPILTISVVLPTLTYLCMVALAFPVWRSGRRSRPIWAWASRVWVIGYLLWFGRQVAMLWWALVGLA